MSEATQKPEFDEHEQPETAVEAGECCAETDCCGDAAGGEPEAAAEAAAGDEPEVAAGVAAGDEPEAAAGTAPEAGDKTEAAAGATTPTDQDAANAGSDQAAPTAADPESESLEDVTVDLADLDPRDAEIAQLKDDLARAQADYLNLQNEYGKYVRRAKAEAPVLRGYGHAEVAEALLSVLDDIQAARDAGELSDGPFAAIATKLESVLATKFKFERFGAVGEEFDPHQHEALMAQTSAEVEVATVGQVLQPGYRIGERVLRAAKVLVHNPE